MGTAENPDTKKAALLTLHALYTIKQGFVTHTLGRQVEVEDKVIVPMLQRGNDENFLNLNLFLGLPMPRKSPFALDIPRYCL